MFSNSRLTERRRFISPKPLPRVSVATRNRHRDS
jgi:hypothetical protein